MRDDFPSALAEVAEAMQFEHWLRFYFLREEEGGELTMDIPEEVQALIQRDHALLWPLAERLNNRTIDYQTSLGEVCGFAARNLDGVRHRPGLMDRVFDSRDLKLEMHLFTLWLSGHETAFDAEVMPFAKWRELFVGWRASKKVQDYLAKATAPGNGQDSCKTMQ